MKSIRRFGVSLEEELLKKLDDFSRKHKFPNRSQAVRFLIRNNIVQEKWQLNKEVAGCVSLIYDHHKRDLLNKSINLQHNYQSLVLSVQHVHLDHHNCLEVIALKGKAAKLRELADKLIALKGIKHGQLTMSVVNLDR
ncbi:MAG: nickel-responsive transcriptional regulator NikR [Candidatus Omnitrophica bacterium]|jgi:CopG family nickel-responsive transcriptional regulator|nr:nickel-responsive transcriptional regulator NikR [Candidatus Omnitrophota bacterium]